MTDATIPDINEALGSLQDELIRLTVAVEHIEQSKEVARQAVNAANKVIEASQGLTEPTRILVDRISKIDFPNRLDKLDSGVGALHIGLQNTQGRLDDLERSMRDNLHSIREDIKKLDQSALMKMTELEDTISRQGIALVKTLKNLRWLTIGSLVGLAAILIVILR